MPLLGSASSAAESRMIEISVSEREDLLWIHSLTSFRDMSGNKWNVSK